MPNLSKNVIKLIHTHLVVGVESIWILPQIFIKHVEFTKLLTTLIYRVYPIPMILLPSMEKQCCCCLPSIHGKFNQDIDEDAKHVLNHTSGKTHSS